MFLFLLIKRWRIKNISQAYRLFSDAPLWWRKQRSRVAPATWVMYRSPRSVQLDWCGLSRTTVYTVNTKYRAIHKRRLKKKERGRARKPCGPLDGKRSGARGRASRGRRMEFTPTNSISVWEKTRSSDRLHAPRGKYIPENAGHRSSSSHRASRCCRGKNRAALKDDILAIWRDVGFLSFSLSLSLSHSLSRYSTRSVICDPSWNIRIASQGTGDDEI